MKKKNQILIGLALALVVVVSISIYLVINNQTRESVSVRFPIPIVEAGQASFYLAQDLGYYEDEGLTVRFEMGSPEANPITMVASNQDDFGVIGGPDTLLVARSKGVPIKAVAVIHRNSNFPCLVTLASSGITKVEQLEGRDVGFFYGHISTDVLRNLFRRQNVEVNEVDVGFDYSQLIAGQIDAQWAFTVTAGFDLPAKGIDINVISPADYGIVTHGYTLFATEATIAEKPELVLAFVRASLRGVKAAVDDPEAATDALLRRGANGDRALALRRQAAYNEVTSASEDYPPGYMDREMFASTHARLVEEGVISQTLDLDAAFTTEFIDQLQRD